MDRCCICSGRARGDLLGPCARDCHPRDRWRAPGRKADDGSRTRDLELGKLALYQLSYVRAGADSKAGGAAAGGRPVSNASRVREPPPFLAVIAVLAVVGLLAFGLAQKGAVGAERRRGGPGRAPAPARRRRARARSPTTAASGCWSTSGPPGACRAARSRRRWRSSSGSTAAPSFTVLGIDTHDLSGDGLDFVARVRAQLSAAARRRRRRGRTTSAPPGCRRTSWSTRSGKAAAAAARPGHRRLPAGVRRADAAGGRHGALRLAALLVARRSRLPHRRGRRPPPGLRCPTSRTK